MFRGLPDDLDYSSFFGAVPDKRDPYLSRELLSILRSDLTILTSDFEQKFLEDAFGIADTVTIPFFYSKAVLAQGERYAQQMTQKRFFDIRRNFVWLGNFQHYPNHVGR